MEPVLLIRIGFLPVRIWDVLDILIVTYFLYKLYQLLRGSIGFQILLGVLVFFVVWWLVSMLQMSLTGLILEQFFSVGVLAFIIIFQPEVRRFLLMLGSTTFGRQPRWLQGWIEVDDKQAPERLRIIQEIKSAILRMSRSKTGSLIVLSHGIALENITTSYVPLDARVSSDLLESIFFKDNPLHDGAVVISQGRVVAARCILPNSERPDLPKTAGLRHRAAVGVTERAQVLAIVTSEETGSISYAWQGELHRRISEERLTELLNEHVD